ncbi:hypothetical protein ACTG9Q_06045 [Actinokineospora sp. 24-640]
MSSPDEDIAVVHAVARGLLALAEVDRLTAFSMPYPESAQSALDRLTLACLIRGAHPPRSLPDLVRWCGIRPLGDWPLRLPPTVFSGGDLLVDARRGRPSDLCGEWAADGATGAAQPLRDLAEKAPDADQHLACRLFLIDHPMVSKTEVEALSGDRAHRRTWRLVKDLYEPVPRTLTRRGEAARCATCQVPSVPLGDGTWLCERESCTVPDIVGDRFPVAGALALPSALRASVIGAGRVEQAVVATVVPRGARSVVEPDHVDVLRVDWLDGERWHVLARGHRNPALLARQVARSSVPSGSDRVLIVVPSHRLRDQPDYREVFNRCLPDGPALVSDAELVDLLGARPIARAEV